MKCYKQNCPGREHEELITYTVRPGGRVAVISRVPATVCDFCGATGFSYETSLQLARIRQGGQAPVGSVPLYDYAQAFPERLREKLIANNYGTVNMAELPPFKCRLPGHPGVYKQETTVYQRCRNGQLVVVDNVPQLVCNICTDTLYEEQTLRQLDRLLDSDIAPITFAPLYEFAQGKVIEAEKELAAAGK